MSKIRNSVANQLLRCVHNDVTIEFYAERTPGREIQDYVVRCVNTMDPTVEYRFDMIMVRTPPRYIVNSVKINKLPYEHGGANHDTKFIWLRPCYIPDDAKYVFQQTIEVIVDYIKKQQLCQIPKTAE